MERNPLNKMNNAETRKEFPNPESATPINEETTEGKARRMAAAAEAVRLDKENSAEGAAALLEKLKNNAELAQAETAKDEVNPEAREENLETKWEDVTRKVQELYINLANEYLEEKSLLKKRIIDFYSDSDRLKGEMKVVFKDLNEEEIDKKIDGLAEKFEDRTFFIEYNDKIFERAAVSQGIKNRMSENPLATEEEYNLGVYREGLETQVRDAIFVLQGKGYKTFESGFREKSDNRDQYIGMYNKHINIPDSVIDYFKEKQFEISVVNKGDRTVVNIHPENANAITLEEWKAIWDDFAEKLPVTEKEDFSDIENYQLHTSFRAKQDSLKGSGASQNR